MLCLGQARVKTAYRTPDSPAIPENYNVALIALIVVL